MRVSAESLMVLAIVLATASLAIVAALWAARKRRDVELRHHGTPLLVMPQTTGPDVARVAVGDEVARSRSSPIRQVAIDASVASAEFATVHAPRGPTIMDPLTATTHRFVSGTAAPEVVHGHSLRFHRPADGTLEFLAGYLEVVGGPDAGHEVRFVRPVDGANAIITFGRREGPAYTHIQLLEPTVSRAHARLVQEGERWRLANLSRTNPVVVNRAPLDGTENSQLLNDADLIEMGALVFQFHAR